MPDWQEIATREESRYLDGEERLPDDPDMRQRQLTRMGNAANGTGLAELMAGDTEGAARWFTRAADRYRESYENAPAGSWGRPIGAVKTRVLAGDWAGAERAGRHVRWRAQPIPRLSAACLAQLVLGRREEARILADTLRTHEGFPSAVGDALAFIAAEDVVGYTVAIEAVLESFETRTEYLEDVPVSDTVIVLQALAQRRGIEVELESPLLPPT